MEFILAVLTFIETSKLYYFIDLLRIATSNLYLLIYLVYLFVFFANTDAFRRPFTDLSKK